MVQIKLSVALILTVAVALMAPVVARPTTQAGSVSKWNARKPKEMKVPGPDPHFKAQSMARINMETRVNKWSPRDIPDAGGSYFLHQQPYPAQHPPASNSPPHPSTGQHPPASHSPGSHTASSETNRVRSVSTKLKAVNAFVSGSSGSSVSPSSDQSGHGTSTVTHSPPGPPTPNSPGSHNEKILSILDADTTPKRPVSVSNSITKKHHPGPIPNFPPPSSRGIPGQVMIMEILGGPRPYPEVGPSDRHASGSYFPPQPSPGQHPPASNSPGSHNEKILSILDADTTPKGKDPDATPKGKDPDTTPKGNK
jgi:hypothetical protein